MQSLEGNLNISLLENSCIQFHYIFLLTQLLKEIYQDKITGNSTN